LLPFLLSAKLMVVFECARCNETVKKPKLAKHLQSCRSEYVSCIDCSVRFRWDEWESHTSCVSEAQKYQGNLYQAKESANKGKVKQDTWTDNVQKAIEEAGSKISPQIKMLLEKLLGFDNIPRKQKPFTNFVKNSLKIWDERKVAEIWEVISAAGKKAELQKSEAAAPAAAPTIVVATEAAPAKAAVRWAGWKRALDGELEVAGGALPWKRLRDTLVARYHASSEENGVPEELLRLQALAAIPEGYLSQKDELVRMTKGSP